MADPPVGIWGSRIGAWARWAPGQVTDQMEGTVARADEDTGNGDSELVAEMGKAIGGDLWHGLD